MLPLEREQWEKLKHAYGPAGDIADLLIQLEAFPPDVAADAEPYFSLWSALCHQGDVYDASYAAVPHFVRLVEEAPERASWHLYSFVGAIEAARVAGRGPAMPPSLSKEYRDALERFPLAVARAAAAPWSELRCRALLGALAIVKGQARLGEVIEALAPHVVEKLLDEL